MMRARTSGLGWRSATLGCALAVAGCAGVLLALAPVSGVAQTARTPQAGQADQTTPTSQAGQADQTTPASPAAQADQTTPTSPAAGADGTVEEDATAQEAQATQEPETFDGLIGLVINYIDPASTSVFESVMSGLLEGLAASEDAERVAQAAGWKMFKAQEPGPDGQAVYIWLLDPVVEGADYSVPQLLNETFPADVQQLYDTYIESFGLGQIWLNLDSATNGDGDEGSDR